MMTRFRQSIAGSAIVASGMLSSVPLGATGDLYFSPAKPRVGDPIAVEYRDSNVFEQQNRLVLRAYFRSAADEPDSRLEHVRAAELARGPGGVFRGTFRLPAGAVYGAFAVEDPTGLIVDSNGRELWELLIHDHSDAPSFAALEQKVFDLTGRNWPLSLETVRTITELHPDRVQGWFYRAAYESQIAGEAGIETLQSFHRSRLRKIEAEIASSTIKDPDQVAWVGRYAWAAGDPAAGQLWEEQLLRDFPAHPLAVQLRAVGISRTHRGNPAYGLADLERLWDEVGPANAQFLDIGFDIARQAGDPVALRRWSARREALSPWTRRSTAIAFASNPELRNDGMQRLRSEIQRLEAVHQEDRDLRRTVEEQRIQNRDATRPLLAALGHALLADGETRAALDTLRLAVADTWIPRLFGQIAETEMSLGNIREASDLWARMAFDPNTAETFTDSIRVRLGDDFDPDRWAAVIPAARAELRHHVLKHSVRIPIAAPITLSGMDGNRELLSETGDGAITFVAFWSRRCGHSLAALPQLQRVAERLAFQGVKVVTITDEPVSDDLEAFLEREGIAFPVFHDALGEARRAFNQWGTPEYFVLDAAGEVRFEGTGLPDVLRQVQVLLSDSDQS